MKNSRLKIGLYVNDPAANVLPSVSHLNLDYGGKGDCRQMLDLCLPQSATGPTPVILWFHGGGMAQGR